MYSTSNPRPLNGLAAQPSCGCAAPPAAPPPSPSTAGWSSNLFGAELGGASTGQLAPYYATPWQTLASSIAVAGTALGAYHGYKRTGSVGWAIGWALLGGVFPFITIPVALAQGFGKPEPAFRGVRGGRG